MATANHTTEPTRPADVNTAHLGAEKIPPATYTTTAPVPIVPGTPEALFIVHPGADRHGDRDVLSCCVLRAQSIIALLQADGEEDDFSLNHTMVMNALWAVDGLLDQMRMTLNGPITRGE